ncbi:hypothetical protein D0817_02210 [Flavobacterium cupreum]|uniref:DUF1579 domain-containing protein n=1 Tax=Flavobacterium cupreum TaxID=2133766 RepID=A0A434ADJ5_9FLAO|nr:hypothetical protein [Flavobacterium cupreum]RUT72441.1 hypothetical protein D0817_02210 [Flavobacterium cupreum]
MIKLLLLLVPFLSFSQQKKSAKEALNELGPENSVLAKRAGLWNVTETVWEYPGAKAVVIKGMVAERVMIGLMLQEFIRPLKDTLHHDVRRTDLITFNQLESRWNYVSFDTRAPVGLMPAWGNVRGDGTKIDLNFAPFAVVADAADIKGQLMIMDQSFIFKDENSDVKDQYFMLADGKGTRWLGRRYSFVRIK